MRRVRHVLEVFGVAPGEGVRVVALGTYSLFIGIYGAFFFASSYALFLDRFEITFLPISYIAAAVVGYIAVLAFSRLERAVSISWLLVISLSVLLSLLLILWFLLTLTGNKWVVFLLFVWIGPTFSIIFLGYWGLAGRLFDLRQGKRLFGLVGAGEELSTAICFFLVPVLVAFFGGPTPLLLLAGGGLLGCLIAVVTITTVYKRRLARSGQKSSKEEVKPERKGLRELLKIRYFVLMAGLMILLNLGNYIVDFGFLAQVRSKFEGPEQIANFIGIFCGVMMSIQFIFKVFFSGRLLNQFGLKFGLMLLPVALSLCVGMAIVAGFLGTAATHLLVFVALSKLMWVVARTALFLPSFRVLYQPIGGADRLAFQTHVEGTSKQLAIGVIGAALLVFSSQGSFDTMHLFYALVPILMTWIFIALLLHRRYRERLMDTLASGEQRNEIEISLHGLLDQLRGASPQRIEDSIALLARMDATAVVPFLVELLRTGNKEAKISIMRYIAMLKPLGALEAVQQCHSTDEDAGVRETAGVTLKILQDVQALGDDPKTVKGLAASEDADERSMAANAIGFSSHPEDHVSLDELLWDKNRDVRRATLVAAGRVGSANYWNRIVSQLFVPMYANAATFALITIGEPVLDEIEKRFSAADSDGRARVLRIYEHIRSPCAQSLLLNKLSFPDIAVRQKALISLVETEFQAVGEQKQAIENAVEGTVATMVWKMASVLDLGDTEAVKDLQAALKDELDQDREKLFDLLALLYDTRAIALLRTNLASSSQEAKVYALEIMDLLVSPDLKPIVLPILEDAAYPQTLRRLANFFPSHRLGPIERLKAIINRERDRIGVWVRMVSVSTLGILAKGVVPNLVAALYHPQLLIQETAARTISILDPEAFRFHRDRLPREASNRLDYVIDNENATEAWQNRSIAGRIEQMRQVASLKTLSYQALVTLAEAAEGKHLGSGQSLPSGNEPKGSIYVLLDGELALPHAKPGGGSQIIPPFNLVVFGAGTESVTATRDCRLLLINADQLYEYAVQFLELIPALTCDPGQILEDETVATEALQNDDFRLVASERGM